MNLVNPLTKKERLVLDTIEFARFIVDILDEKQAADIHLLEIKEVSVIADYFVICSGSSIRLVKALIRSVTEEVKKEYGNRPRIEGDPSHGWMVADYGDLVLHIFSPERRAYYRLEDLWSEGNTVLKLQ